MNERPLFDCPSLPCVDVRHDAFAASSVPIDHAAVRIVLISECVPLDPADDYYAAGEPLFARTTVEAFRDAGAAVSTIRDVLALGVYLTSAVKCPKLAYGISTATTKACSSILERELDLFPNVRAYLLMGDVAIAAVNAIAARSGAKRVIPGGSTYKLRGGDYGFRNAAVFPSYLQAGPSFFIEKRKREMIGQDIAAALRVANI